MDSQLIGVTGFYLTVIFLLVVIILAIAYARRETWKSSRRESSLSEIEHSRIGLTQRTLNGYRVVESAALSGNQIVFSQYSNLLIVSPNVYAKMREQNSFMDFS